jgi:hypothetical protein
MVDHTWEKAEKAQDHRNQAQQQEDLPWRQLAYVDEPFQFFFFKNIN